MLFKLSFLVPGEQEMVVLMLTSVADQRSEWKTVSCLALSVS